jgi:tetratricopeptide (TPR) repeat protein
MERVDLRNRTAVRAAIITALSALSAACMSPLLGREAEIHFEAASKFDAQGDYVSARDQYAQALMRAHFAHAPAETMSMLYYNYGRTAGYTCKLTEAKESLQKAMELELGVSGEHSGVYTMRLMELARLHHDQGESAQSAQYFEKALPNLRALKLQDSDPIALADVLDEYAVVLDELHRSSDIEPVKAEAGAIRAAHPGMKAQFVAVRYRCPK